MPDTRSAHALRAFAFLRCRACPCAVQAGAHDASMPAASADVAGVRRRRAGGSRRAAARRRRRGGGAGRGLCAGHVATTYAKVVLDVPYAAEVVDDVLRRVLHPSRGHAALERDRGLVHLDLDVAGVEIGVGQALAGQFAQAVVAAFVAARLGAAELAALVALVEPVALALLAEAGAAIDVGMGVLAADPAACVAACAVARAVVVVLLCPARTPEVAAGIVLPVALAVGALGVVAAVALPVLAAVAGLVPPGAGAAAVTVRAAVVVLVLVALDEMTFGVGIQAVACVAAGAARVRPQLVLIAIATAVAGGLFLPARLPRVLGVAARVRGLPGSPSVVLVIVAGVHLAPRLVRIAQVTCADAVVAAAVAGLFVVVAAHESLRCGKGEKFAAGMSTFASVEPATHGRAGFADARYRDARFVRIDRRHVGLARPRRAYGITRVVGLRRGGIGRQRFRIADRLGRHHAADGRQARHADRSDQRRAGQEQVHGMPRKRRDTRCHSSHVPSAEAPYRRARPCAKPWQLLPDPAVFTRGWVQGAWAG